MFLGYDKIVDIYASRYPTRMLLINPHKVKTKLLKLLNLEKLRFTYTSAFLVYILFL